MSAAEASRRPSLIEGPIAKTLFMFSLPMLFGNILQSLNGTINSIWVGKFLGEAALTAASNGNIIMFFLISSIFGVTMAATIMIGQNIGAGDVAETKRVVGTSAVFFSGARFCYRYYRIFECALDSSCTQYTCRIGGYGDHVYTYYFRRHALFVRL